MSDWTNDQSIRIEALNIASREAAVRSFGAENVAHQGVNVSTPKKTIIEIAEEIYQFINTNEPK